MRALASASWAGSAHLTNRSQACQPIHLPHTPAAFRRSFLLRAPHPRRAPQGCAGGSRCGWSASGGRWTTRTRTRRRRGTRGCHRGSGRMRAITTRTTCRLPQRWVSPGEGATDPVRDFGNRKKIHRAGMLPASRLNVVLLVQGSCKTMYPFKSVNIRTHAHARTHIAPQPVFNVCL